MKQFQINERTKITDYYRAINSLGGLESLEENVENTVKSNMSDLLTLLFGGVPKENIKKRRI